MFSLVMLLQYMAVLKLFWLLWVLANTLALNVPMGDLRHLASCSSWIYLLNNLMQAGSWGVASLQPNLNWLLHILTRSGLIRQLLPDWTVSGKNMSEMRQSVQSIFSLLDTKIKNWATVMKCNADCFHKMHKITKFHSKVIAVQNCFVSIIPSSC